MSSLRRHSTDTRAGFALLITITLLAFLVLLLVSLAALTRVETQVASNNQQLSQARQNALVGLNIALGRLQALAGPDQRITATADLIPGAHNDKRRWTGVWKTTETSPIPEWLVSTSTPEAAIGVPSVASALPGSGTATLVGANTVDIATPGNSVVVQTQPIVADNVPGMSGARTVGNFAYWVGDEGVKAKVSLTDPWANPSPGTLNASTPPTTTAQAEAYRFVHAQRPGIEFVDTTSPGTPLGSHYPAGSTALSRVFDLNQFPFSNPSAESQTALGATAKNRFHDLTASSRSVLADVARGGLKKDLTAWTADTSSTTPFPASPPSPSDDYITPGDPDDTAKYGLPKWELIRSYANTRDTGGALAPRVPTPSQQGVSPVITYVRMGYNLSMPDAATGFYRINVMPVIVLWNPNSVPLAKSVDDDTSYEFCVKYKSTTFGGLGGTVVTNGVRLRLVFTSTVTPANPTDSFHLPTVQIQSGAPGPLGPVNTYASYAAGPSPQISTSAAAEPAFWRFKVKLSRDLAPGESRIFTISDDSDETVYAAGQSELSDAVFGTNNAVYIPGNSALNASQTADEARVFWNTEPNFGGSDYSIRPHAAMTEFRLTKPVPSGISNLAAVDAFLSDPDNTYQAILGNAFTWEAETNPVMFPPEILPPANNGRAITYQRVEMLMSSNYDRFVSGTKSPGTPRWLAQLNPQAAVSLRKSSPATTPSSPVPAGVLTPSYENQMYIKREGVDPSNYPHIPLPDADGTRVSAGTEISTLGDPQNVVLRAFPPASAPLFSIAQLQHAGASLLNLNPAYAIGNSLANLYVPRTAIQSDELPQDAFNTYSPNNTFPGFPDPARFRHIYDLSYLLNQALWDRCFFSTIPASLTAAQVANPDYHLPNARHQFLSRSLPSTSELADLTSTDRAAARLILNGGFNVNSTSEQAWRALLASHYGVATDPSESTKRHPFSRLPSPVDPSTPNTTWGGYRILSDKQIDTLAKAIVAEVRKRGPFLSLADFVNRRLVADETGLTGPLQAAIDATTSGTGSINGGAPFNFDSYTMAHFPPDIVSDEEQQVIYKGSTNPSLPASTPVSSRAAFAPGYLTQADLLTAIGPSLTARSDTFRIRAYGDVVNPVTGNTDPEARAWCEAIVQRLPDYVDDSLAPSDSPAAGSDAELFGRRFQIVSFRWLSPDDI